MGVRVPLRRLLRRSRRRRKGRVERAVMGPRRLKEGTTTAETRLFMHFIPSHAAVHAVVELVGRVQL